LLEDRWIDQADDVLAGAKAGGLDHGLHPATIGDDAGGPLVVLAVQIGSGERPACVALVEPGLEVAASTGSSQSELAHGSAGAALLLALARGLLLGLPAHLLFGPPLGRAAGRVGGAQLPPTSHPDDYVFVGRACNGDTLSADPSGKVALISRGTCFFSDKAANAAAAGATAAVIVNNQTGAFPQATRLVNSVGIPVVGISGAAGTAMGASGTLTWTDWTQNGFYAQGCGGGGICNSGTLALVDSVLTANSGTAGGGVLQKSGTLTLAGSTSFSSNRGTFGGGIGHPAGTVNAADGTSTYTDPISGARLPAWTGSFVDNFIGNCNPTITLGSFNCTQ